MFKKDKKDQININYDDNKHSKKWLIIILSCFFLFFIIFLFVKSLNSKKITYSIELNGESEMTIFVHDKYIEPGYKSYDNKGNDTTDSVRIINTIENSKEGTYEIAYIIGKEIVIRKVNVIKKTNNYTVIHLKGNNLEYIEKGTKYIEPGYVAVDTKDGDITNLVKVTGMENINTVGIHKLVYSVENSEGIITTVVRNVIVTESSISLTIDNNEFTNSFVTINIGINDNNFSHLVLPNGQKTTSKIYQYQVFENGTYKFTKYDKNNNTLSEEIKVTNIDKKKPTGTCIAEVGYNTKIKIKASDENGIKYYKYNNKNYYNNIFTINGTVSSAEVTIYDNANNKVTINCTIKRINNPTSSTSSSSKPSTSTSSSKPSTSKPSTSTSKPSTSTSSSKPSTSTSSSKPSTSSSSSQADYDTISNTFSGNKHIADFMAMFEGADKTEYSSGYECNSGKGYIVKQYPGVLTTAYGLTNLAIKDEEHPNGVYPCDTMSKENKKYFTKTKFVKGACIPKNAIREALVCQINYVKKTVNNKLNNCAKGTKLTKQQMAALVDYGNSGVGFLTKVLNEYCNAIKAGKTVSKAEDAMFKKMFAKSGQGNSNGNCKYIKRRECEASLYFNGNYTCYGQNIYSNNTFTYHFKKYHDSGYSCTS